MRCFAIENSDRALQTLRKLGLKSHFFNANCSDSSLSGRTLLFSSRTWKKIFEDKSKGDRLIRDGQVQIRDVEFDEKECRTRLLYTLESYLQDPPPSEVLEEFLVLLHANKNLCIEYVGRNVSRNCPPLMDCSIQIPETVFHFDFLGGKRRYLWRSRDLSEKGNFEDPRLRFKHLKRWLSDSDSRVQLSLGCGALRLLAIPTVLKVIDLIGAREDIHEVWGNSGGAIVGYLYSAGISPHYIEQIGYDLYNQRYPEHVELKRSLVSSAFATMRRLAFHGDERSGLFEIQSLLTTAMEKVRSGQTNIAREILPFFAVAMNLNQEKIFGLTDHKYTNQSCEDFLLGCDPLRAVAASSAIPFLFKAEQLATSDKRADHWHDAILGEDVPLLIPYKKWRIESQRNKNTVPQKLKILYVDLGLHYIEFFLSQKLAQIPALQFMSKFMHMSHAVFESRAEVQKDFLRMSPDVDILGMKLELDRTALFDVAQIPQIIQGGRTNLLKQLLELEETLAERGDDDSFYVKTKRAS